MDVIDAQRAFDPMIASLVGGSQINTVGLIENSPTFPLVLLVLGKKELRFPFFELPLRYF